MTLFRYRLTLCLTGLFGLLALTLFVFGTDPSTLSAWGMTLFFLSLLVVASSVSSLLLLALGSRFIGEAGTLRAIGSFLRQGALLGFGALGLALLLFFSLLAWWSVLLWFAFLLLVEVTARRLTPSE